MKLSFVSERNSMRLLLIYAGWGMDDSPFRSLSLPGYDIAVVYDYRTTSIDSSELSHYREIHVIAWSFGVFMASVSLPAMQLPVVRTVAVNGTTHPIHDTMGIPRAIFDGTLSSLSPRTLLKFYRRMCCDSTVWQTFQGTLPRRHIESLIHELRAIDLLYSSCPDTSMVWQRAYIANADRIFPPQNMAAAWQSSHTPAIEMPWGHLPDWNELIRREFIDKTRVAQRFVSSAHTYDAHARVQRLIATRLWQLWKCHTTQPTSRIIEIGPGTGLLTRLYAPAFPDAAVELWDLAPQMQSLPPNATMITGDAENLIHTLAPASVDAIVSSSSVQWFDSLPTFIDASVRALRPGGLLALSTFGPRNMHQLRLTTGLGLNYYTLDQIKCMTPSCATIVEASESIVNADFDSPREILRHLGLTGVNALHGNFGLTRRLLHDYPLSPEGTTQLTYHPIYIILQRHS